MITKLLILADEHGYFRFSADGTEYCSMEKATVFPFDDVNEVKSRQAGLLASGFAGVVIKVLTIHEEKYVE